jgi:hypothetical protein
MRPPPVPVRDKIPETPAKSRIVPFVDGSFVDVPATPKFTPFRDEVCISLLPHSRIVIPNYDKQQVTPAGISSPTVPEMVMKVKKKALGVSEAEMLRKDPLKNYAEDDVVGSVG